jgi:hypothetical protein
LGISLYRDAAENELELRTGIALAHEHRNVVRVLVGNEVCCEGI